MPDETYGKEDDSRQQHEELVHLIRLETNAVFAVENKIIHMRFDKTPHYDGGATGGDPLAAQYPVQWYSARVQVPLAPPGVDVDANIIQARESFDPMWFVHKVKPDGEWDYKKRGMKYENIGNFNYGATALAFGFTEQWALMAAGAVHIYKNKTLDRFEVNQFIEAIADYKKLFQGPPYGDDIHDQYMIKLGFRYYKEEHLKKYPPPMTSKEQIAKFAEAAYANNFKVLQAFPWVADRLRSSLEDAHERHGPVFADSRLGRTLVCRGCRAEHG